MVSASYYVFIYGGGVRMVGDSVSIQKTGYNKQEFMNTKLSVLIRSHYKHSFSKNKFIPGISPVPVSGKVFDEEELKNGA